MGRDDSTYNSSCSHWAPSLSNISPATALRPSCPVGLSQSRGSEAVRLGFFECHVCLLDKTGDGGAAPPQLCNTKKESSSDPGLLYHLSASAAPPLLQQDSLKNNSNLNHAGPFLILSPEVNPALERDSHHCSEAALRCWRMTSVIDALTTSSGSKLEFSQNAPSSAEDEYREPWSNVICRVAHWLTAACLSATLLVFGGNRNTERKTPPHCVKENSFFKAKDGARWRPCVAQRACAEVFALSKSKGNTCKMVLNFTNKDSFKLYFVLA